MKTREIKSYKELEKLYKNGVRKVYVEYVKDNWCIAEDELVDGIHQIEELDFEELDLLDSENRFIGCINNCLLEKLIRVYEVEE